MGIPHLFTHLQPYGVLEDLGCRRRDGTASDLNAAEKTTHFIIDGPSLAYHILYRLLAHKSSTLNVLDAIPSYQELGEGFLAFLDELQSHGAKVDHIFFDGLLPPLKQETRQNRQAQSLQDLSLFHATHLTGFEPSHPSDVVVLSYKNQVLRPSRKVPIYFRNLLPPAFLVPAILDTLRASHYHARTRLVPEEADVSCARAARESGGIILTSDSDMLVYDLGRDGAVAFLSSLQLVGEAPIGRQTETSETLRMSVWRPERIASKLDLPNLARLAYEIRQDQYLTLNEVVQRVRNSKDTTDFHEFMKEYEINPITEIVMTSKSEGLVVNVAQCQHFDPRVAELFFLIVVPNEKHTASMYLPILLEDPSKSTAWAASSRLRALAYAILTHHFSNERHARAGFNIVEYVRKGSRFVPEEIDLAISDQEPEEQARDLAVRFRNLQPCTEEASEKLLQKSKEESLLSLSNLSYNLFSLSEIYAWYVRCGKTVPSATSMTRVLSIPRVTRWTWEDVHLAAQVQGFLYSLRMLGQILRYVRESEATVMSPGFESLYEICTALPKLEQLTSSSDGDVHKDVLIWSQRAVERLMKKLHADRGSPRMETANPEDSKHNSKTNKTNRKSRREKHGKPQTRTTAKASGSGNMYHVLAEGNT